MHLHHSDLSPHWWACARPSTPPPPISSHQASLCPNASGNKYVLLRDGGVEKTAEEEASLCPRCFILRILLEAHCASPRAADPRKSVLERTQRRSLPLGRSRGEEGCLAERPRIRHPGFVRSWSLCDSCPLAGCTAPNPKSAGRWPGPARRACSLPPLPPAASSRKQAAGQDEGGRGLGKRRAPSKTLSGRRAWQEARHSHGQTWKRSVAPRRGLRNRSRREASRPAGRLRGPGCRRSSGAGGGRREKRHLRGGKEEVTLFLLLAPPLSWLSAVSSS